MPCRYPTLALHKDQMNIPSPSISNILKASLRSATSSSLNPCFAIVDRVLDAAGRCGFKVVCSEGTKILTMAGPVSIF